MSTPLKAVVNRLLRRMEAFELKEIETSSLSSLSRKQLFYLDTVHRLQNPTLGELAIELNLSKPSITAIVDRFVSMGYVVKVKSDADKRSSHVHLTEQGKALAGLHDMIHEAISNQLTNKLSAEETQLLTILLTKALSETEEYLTQPTEQFLPLT